MRQGDQLLPAFGQEGLVGGDERLAGGDSGLRHLSRFGGASKQLDHDLHSRVGDDGFPIGYGRQGEAFPLFGRIADGYGADFQPDSQTLLEQSVGLGEIPDQTGAYRATTNQADPHLVHWMI